MGCTVIIRLLYPRQNGHPHADCICIQDILDENVYLSSVGLFTLVVSKKIWTNYMIQVYWVVIVSNKDWTKNICWVVSKTEWTSTCWLKSVGLLKYMLLVSKKIGWICMVKFCWVVIVSNNDWTTTSVGLFSSIQENLDKFIWSRSIGL